MKRIIKQTILFLFGAILFTGYANAQTIKLKPGSKLIYGVDAWGEKCDFTVIIKSLKPLMVFEYEMIAPGYKKGTVTITGNDMDSARELWSDFSGVPHTLSGQTSMFLSRKVYDELEKKDDTKFKPNTLDKIRKFGNVVESPAHYIINGKELEIMTETLDDKANVNDVARSSFTVLMDKDLPLLLSMDIGWKLTLKEMKDVDYYKKEK